MKISPSWEQVLDAASGDVRRLSYVDRYTSIPVNFRENVSEHSYWVTLYSAMVHMEVGGPDALISAILSYALVHDIVECISGDLVRTFKYSTEELKKAVDQAEDKLAAGFPQVLKDVIALPWKLVHDPEEIAYVKAVVKLADFVSLHQYMVREKGRGNGEIGEFFDRMQVDMKMMANKYKSEADPRIQSMSGLFELMSKVETVSKRTA